MKGFLLTCLTALAGSTLASPAAVKRDDAVTTSLINDFRLYAQYAAAASCNNQNAVGQALTCPGTFCPLVTANNATTVATFSGPLTDIRGLVAVDHAKRAIIVSIRGTVSVRNWITDFIFPQLPVLDLCLGCLVHTGFLTAWKEISSAALAGLKTAKTANPFYAVIFTGHSLGASVATIGAAYARRAGYAGADIYTFGSPRAGNSFFANFVTNQPGNEYRVTHANDPIARLPPLVLNYRHTSPEYWLQSTDPSPSDVTVCQGNANLKCNGGTGGFDMSQHSLYFQQLNGCGPETDTPWKQRRDLSDEEIAAQLAEWAREDAELVAELGGGVSIAVAKE
ncbi:Alpha/Beta hydrolase protein [Echria macrotheca]|uniref:Alpha/Beta hydrolase protein n=1 Tax=Echria macrotheca TaxID=438768 RepID=A0AAJ0BAK9_9PEZI|nr:Alpha/Beta hydrolase protein [Echria macrotheca]